MSLTISGIWSLLSNLGWLFVKTFHVVRNWNFLWGDSYIGLETEGPKEKDETAGTTKVEPLHKYNVFINHRGPDVKLTFVGHLTDALCKAGFHPFLDAKSVGQGRHIFDSVDGALNGACVHLAVFSKRYAESKYCLEELSKMLQSKKVIIPVFYDVEPENLRWIDKGPFRDGFRKHESHGRHKEIKQWKEDLSEIADRRGFRKDEVAGDENQLIKRIVVAVQNQMPVLVHPQKRRFGLRESLNDVLRRVDMMGDNVGILGLVGMGGIGKTTLAKEIYNHFVSRQDFQYHSFLKDVRSKASLLLQRKLVRNLIKEDVTSHIFNYQYWFDVFSTHKVLIIIDDIDNVSQFKGLIPNILLLAPGSRIVVTSRHWDVLNQSMGPATHKELFEVKVLNPFDSQQLFNWHAFYSETPSEGFFELAKEVAEACGGHPLALEVIGASLFDKKDLADKAIWVDAIKILKENDDILDKLKISYSGLPSDGDRAMFLDIACHLIGMRDEVAIDIWTSCCSCSDYCSTSKGPNLVLRRLVDKSLVKLDEHGMIRMHDVIRDMGRDVVVKESPRHPGKRTHLWDAATAAKVLKKNEGTQSVRGIKLSSSESDSVPTYVTEQFASVEELHLLVLNGCRVVGDDFSKWSQALRWLQWKSFPSSKLPSTLYLENLVVLDLTDSGNLTHLWHGDSPIEFPFLQRLILTNCRGLAELPHNIGQRLPRLKIVEMEKCVSITTLPNSVGQLKYLKHLILSGCENITTLPDAVGEMTELQRLILEGCSNLKQLPIELERLNSLEELQLSKCKDLYKLPSSMGGLRMLKELHMHSTPVEKLPEDFGQLILLRTLTMSNLLTVPQSFGGLGSLSFLCLANCKLEGRLPTIFGALTALKTLHLRGNQLVSVEALPRSLQELDMSDCPQLSILPSLAEMSSLTYLNLSNCRALSIDALPESIQHLDMAKCPHLISLPSLANMSALRILDLYNCRGLTHIQGLENVTTLEEVNLAGCTSILQNGLQISHNRSLRTCCLSGSTVAVTYNNTLSEDEPALQLISYYDNYIGYLPDGMVQIVKNGPVCFYELLIETNISSTMDCVAIIFCFVVHDQDWSSYPWNHGEYNNEWFLEIRVVRDGKVNHVQLLTFKNADRFHQVYLCTLRRKHRFLQTLKFGDKLCVYARSKWQGWALSVQKGAICVVYGENEQQILSINSKLLDRDETIIIAGKLGKLILANNPSSTMRSRMEYDEGGRDSNKNLANERGAINISNKLCNNDVIILDKIMTHERDWMIGPLFGLYSWTHYWKLPKSGRGIISFTAKGTNDIHIAISTQSQTIDPMYEIVIGGWGNTYSAVRKSRQWPLLSSVKGGLNHPQGANQLWVSIDDRSSLIEVGQGEPGQGVITTYMDRHFLSEVQYISFTTWDTPVTYSNTVVTDVEHNRVLDKYSLSKRITQPMLNHKWTIRPLFGHYDWDQHWMLPRPGRGILSFASAGSNDVHVAISPQLHTMHPMYEIVIGGWGNSHTGIRRQTQGPLSCAVKLGLKFVSQFWVSIDDRTGIIQIGQGQPCENVICVWKDVHFIADAQYFTFTTWSAAITYSNIGVTKILD